MAAVAPRAIESLRQIARRFPSSSVPSLRMAFAYGSGVFQQSNYAPLTLNMIDLCLVVDAVDAAKWHAENLTTNPDDYSLLMKKLGSEKLALYQESSFGAKVFCNTLVKTSESQLIKYGVISTESLINDLLDWTSLYVAGRLHKPVLYLEDSSLDDLNSAIKVNLENAVHTALLLLPEQFNQFQLFTTLTSLSYTGDVRMGIAENDDKISNVVTANLEHFQNLYADSLEQPHIKQYVNYNESSKIYDQDASSNTLYHHLNYLPHNLISKIVDEYNKDGRHRDREEVMHIVKDDFRLNQKVLRGLREIVIESSWKQTAKNIPTAGLGKSLHYLGNKLKKKWSSGKKTKKPGRREIETSS